jgi:hypothetical protein
METIGTFAPDNLLAGEQIGNIRSKAIVLASGAGALSRGTILGKKTLLLGTPVLTGTGNGTIGTVSLGAKAKKGNYLVKCITAATNGGTFQVIDPDGNLLPNAVVGTAFTNSQINFTISDGSTDFDTTSLFTVPVGAGSGEYLAAKSDAVDGSQKAVAILIADVDATSAKKPAHIYESGEFNSARVICGKTEDTVDLFVDDLEKRGIIMRSAISNGD